MTSIDRRTSRALASWLKADSRMISTVTEDANQKQLGYVLPRYQQARERALTSIWTVLLAEFFLLIVAAVVTAAVRAWR